MLAVTAQILNKCDVTSSFQNKISIVYLIGQVCHITVFILCPGSPLTITQKGFSLCSSFSFGPKLKPPYHAIITIVFSVNSSIWSRSFLGVSVLLGYGTTSLASNVLRQCSVVVFEARMYNVHWTFNTWRWDHYTVSKCHALIAKWHGSTSQKNRGLNCTTANTSKCSAYVEVN